MAKSVEKTIYEITLDDEECDLLISCLETARIEAEKTMMNNRAKAIGKLMEDL